MSAVWLLISKPGAIHEGRLVGNPDVVAEFSESEIAADWQLNPEVEVPKEGNAVRLLEIVTSVPLRVSMCYKGESPEDTTPAPVPVPQAGLVTYSAVIPEGVSGIFLKADA